MSSWTRSTDSRSSGKWQSREWAGWLSGDEIVPGARIPPGQIDLALAKASPEPRTLDDAKLWDRLARVPPGRRRERRPRRSVARASRLNSCQISPPVACSSTGTGGSSAPSKTLSMANGEAAIAAPHVSGVQAVIAWSSTTTCPWRGPARISIRERWRARPAARSTSSVVQSIRSERSPRDSSQLDDGRRWRPLGSYSASWTM